MKSFFTTEDAEGTEEIGMQDSCEGLQFDAAVRLTASKEISPVAPSNPMRTMASLALGGTLMVAD